MNEDEKHALGKYKEIFARLADVFQRENSRPGKNGKDFIYITKEQAMDRLDDCVGPANWDYTYNRDEKIINCIIKIRLPDGETLRRAGCSVIEEDERVEYSTRVKGAYSDAFKVAAQGFGVGRYLKSDDWAAYARRYYHERDGKALAEGGKVEPKAPGRKLEAPQSFPMSARGPSEPPGPEEFPQRIPAGKYRNRPGAVLYRKYSNPPFGNSYVEVLNHYGKERNFPERIVNWSAEQCAEAEEAIEQGVVE